ncbi:hypothetical protein NLU13_7718 [Sarocladium strictum]|uniref:Uncharacterized protein n=1 Tax=Sarocladium strictum TaxID=5046 RepID=A0AA39GFP7_SARSR|nr:hypothetical protein NLU13_7718 [Sarocladium strictum]
MGRYELEYPKDANNTVKRHNERGWSIKPAQSLYHHHLTDSPAAAIYALKTIHSLVNASPLLHISFTPPDSAFPTILPMIGQMGSFDRPSASISDPLDLYIHGYVSSRVMKVARSGKGLPVCVAVSFVDGYVLALSAFNHSYNYRSAVLFGHATIVEDQDEKLYALELITDGFLPGRWNNTRLPPLGAEMQSTSVLKVKIESGSAKFRDGQASDDKHDLENETALNSTWTGVIPIHQTYGDPIASSYNRVEFPGYATEFIEESNKENKEHCVKAAENKGN